MWKYRSAMINKVIKNMQKSLESYRLHEHIMGLWISCRSLLFFNRSFLSLKHFSQLENCSRSQRSAKTRPAFRPIPYSNTSSRDLISGGEKYPFLSSQSTAPFPARVGITTQHSTPHSKAKLIELFAHSMPSCSVRKGGRSKINARD